ncbi:MAG: peptidylprolyl isomerase [Polaribacter sp.]
MQHKTTILKYIKVQILIICIAMFSFHTNAQQIKIDGVAVVIGKNIVLESDIAKFKQEIEVRSEGKVTISDCEMLEELMQQKLLAHHAVIDSVVVSDPEINARVDRSIQFFTQQYGDVNKVVAAYGFNDVDDLRKELFTVQKENILIEKEQQKITEKIDVTPEEVRLYFNGLKEKNELPQFPAEIELAQIVVHALPSKEENERVIAKLNEIKKQIEEGSSFKMKAIINSTDPSVTQNGGNLGLITKKTNFIKEFKEVAFTLDPGQVSKPVKTGFGYHIVKLHEIKGEGRVVSHILIKPEIPDSKLKETKEKVEQIVKDVQTCKITFKNDVKKYSNDNETKNNGGLIINPSSGESRFDLTRMDPAFYARVNELKKGELSNVFYDEERGGEKMYKVILMRDRTDTHVADLINDYVKIQDLALRKKKEETIEKWSKGKMKDTYIKLGSDYTKCEFKRNWKKETPK